MNTFFRAKSSKYYLSFLLQLFSVLAFGVEYQEHQYLDQRLVISTTNGTVSMSAYGLDAFEVVYTPHNTRQLPSFVKAEYATTSEISIEDSERTLIVDAGKLIAIVHKTPFRIEYRRNDNLLLSEDSGFFTNDTQQGFRFKLDENEKLMGAGERVLGMDRRGHRLPLYNKAHYGYETQSEQMYFSLPMVMSDRKYMLVFDNSATGYVDLGKSDNDILQFEAQGGRSAYWVIAGDQYAQIIREYTALSGRQPMPPRWALGSIASRFGYHSEAEVRDVVNRYQALDIPLDAIVLDLYWFGADIKGHMGNLDWDRSAFPNPEKVISDLKDVGVNTVMITEPFILSTSKKWDEAIEHQALAKTLGGEPKQFDFYFGNTGLIDIFDYSAAEWFWKSYQKLLDIGVEGLWGDLGEPEVHPSDMYHFLSNSNQVVSADEIHNAYGHVWAEKVYKNSLRDYPNKRPMIMMRSGFSGSQRYGMIPWTGDVSRSWGGLQSQVELSLQMGSMGLGYIHSDIGGFAGGDAFDAELYTRWLQFGTFQPVFRPHGQEDIPSEPVFHDDKTIAIAKYYIELRYRLLPYLYTLAWQNHTQGLPLARPLMFENEDPYWFDNTQSFMWGDSFLVAPVVHSSVAGDSNLTESSLTGSDPISMSVALPQGVWFDFWTDRRFEAIKDVSHFDMEIPIERIPVLVKAGAIIPMLAKAPMSTKEYNLRDIELHYYADESVRTSVATLYDDDGTTPRSYQSGEYELLRFEANRDGSEVAIRLAVQHSYEGSKGSESEVTIVVHNWTERVGSVSVNGRSISSSDYFKKDNNLMINVKWKRIDETIVRIRSR